MKIIVCALSILASAFVLTGCANKGTEQTNTQATSAPVAATPAHHHGHHHRDYKDEAAK